MNRPPRSRLESGELNYLDYYFARFIAEIDDADPDNELQNLIADVSHALSDQHSCVDLEQQENGGDVIEALTNLDSVGDGTSPTPLVLEDGKLFLHRYFQYETRVAADLSRRNRRNALTAKACRDIMDRWFPDRGEAIDWQRLAALQALTHQLTILTGGPGTGKTTTVIRILAMLLTEDNLIVKLAAPTGKAAMRLSQALNGTLPGLPADVRHRLPREVQTIHRLLGTRADGRSARYHGSHQIPVDILILDEVSMIDLAMMDRLLAAVPESTRLILLGDPDQLPSVDTGNVLADMCRHPAGYSAAFADLARNVLGRKLARQQEPHALQDAICRLEKNFRFDDERGVGALAKAIRQGDATMPATTDDGEIRCHPLSHVKDDPGMLSTAYSSWLEATRQKASPETLIRAFDEHRILSPVREGPLGVLAINEAIESHLRSTGIIDAHSLFYHGRPIIITRNDYNLGLFNGDTGLTYLDPDDGQHKVAFQEVDGQTRLYLASRLPSHETCFAMTVHKSQGSEFDHVSLILPDDLSDTGETVLTRQLLYTAVTRARKTVQLYCDEDTFLRAVTRNIERQSGLAKRFLL